MDTNELKALAKMLTYTADTLSAMLEDDAEPLAEVDWSKPIQTRRGDPVTVVSTNYREWNDKTTAVTVRHGKECDTLLRYNLHGRYAADGGEHELDIINVPEPPAAEKPTGVDWSKPIQTRDGRPATVISVGHGAHVRIATHTYHYRDSGVWFYSGRESGMDIINVPEPPPLDLTKPVQTRDGRRVRILCTDCITGRGIGIVGLVKLDGQEWVNEWSPEGRWMSFSNEVHDMDLVNVPTEQL